MKKKKIFLLQRSKKKLTKKKRMGIVEREREKTLILIHMINFLQ